jgi:hypothetical protein
MSRKPISTFSDLLASRKLPNGPLTKEGWADEIINKEIFDSTESTPNREILLKAVDRLINQKDLVLEKTYVRSTETSLDERVRAAVRYVKWEEKERNKAAQKARIEGEKKR